jgi:hypothetical protein
MEVQLPSSIIARAVFLPVELNWHWAGTERGTPDRPKRSSESDFDSGEGHG